MGQTIPFSGGQIGMTNQQIVVANSAGLTPSQSARMQVFIKEGAAGAMRSIGFVTVSGAVGGGAVIGFWPSCGTTNPPCITNSLARTVVNKAQRYGFAVFEMDGVLKHSEMIGPGQSSSYTYEWCRTVLEGAPTLHYGMSYQESAIISDGDGNYEVADLGSSQTITRDLNSTNSTGVTGGGAGTFADGLASTNQPFTGQITNSTAVNLTNAYPINWNNPDTTAARDATLKAGFNKLAQQNESIINGLVMVNGTIESSGSGGGGSGTNEWPGDFPSMTTSNQLQNITGILTNNPAFDSTNAVGTVSNMWGAAQGHGETQAGEVMDLLSPFEGTIAFDVPAPQDSFWQVTLIPGKPAFDFRPSNYLGGVFDVAKNLITWILAIGYAYLIINDVVKIIKTFGNTNQFHIPNIQGTIFGVGGNWGVALVPALLIIGLAIWAFVLVKIGVGISAAVTGELATAIFTNPFSGAAGSIAAGIGESGMFFPWAIFFGIAGAYLVWDLTIGFVTAFITIAIRFVVG